MYNFRDIQRAGGAPLAVVSTDTILRRTSEARRLRLRFNKASVPAADLVVDLGTEIGTAHWFRGATTCALLCYATWSLAPEVRALPGTSPAPMPQAHNVEAAALAIAPLALGSDTGKRTIPTEAVQPLAQAPERASVLLVATLGQGDGLARLLQRSGLSGSETRQVTAMVGEHVFVDQIRPGTVVSLTLGRRRPTDSARPLESLTFRARLGLRLTIVRVGAQLVLEPTATAIDETPLRIQGRVGASLYRSARAAGAPARVVEAYIRALATQVNVGQMGSDDRFDIVVENRRAASGESESGRLLFAGLQRAGGREIRLMQWTVGGETQWFEASGVGRETAGLTQPVPGRITSGFGYRTHPILGYRRFHRGLDIGAGHGTPILATTDGVVARAGWGGGYGNVVELRHAGGLATRYGHMSRISVGGGQRVRQGQVIGYVGSTGLSTGPHLHYEMFRNGQLVDPRSVRWVSRSQLSGADLEGFRTRMRTLMALPVASGRPKDP
jgi:murein DD-endopeptidase MepM/ murein hydrolase activator NlpD